MLALLFLASYNLISCNLLLSKVLYKDFMLGIFHAQTFT
ncbi:protein of unknown function [Vibrio tapetis subsp. tapetis]|uniref:Uncharacterized protein n=1 Tax=Vibrio tapetis subsp. tapetis TaxID=1671868 RepID=A0A2N8ZLG9_9VIBR|nr:protein of unknown function [Vibrio tapetis subsp. tapetis]